MTRTKEYFLTKVHFQTEYKKNKDTSLIFVFQSNVSDIEEMCREKLFLKTFQV